MTETSARVTAQIGGTPSQPQPILISWQSDDGLALSAMDWRPRGWPMSAHPRHPTILCLSGLSRNSRDFRDIALFLQARGHRVIALDYRGRGRSQWDADWHNYAIPVEGHDIDAAIELMGLDRFIVLGTSRGGLHALAMSGRYRREHMIGVILNDIGPHIEMPAIYRIAMSLGHSMTHPSMDAVADSLKSALGSHFPAFGDADWRKFATQIASERDGSAVKDYDPALAKQLASLDDSTPMPDLWPLFENLHDRPVLVIRGEHSDLLSAETATKMVSDHPDADLITVAGQGHAPVLWEKDLHEQIAGFIDRFGMTD